MGWLETLLANPSPSLSGPPDFKKVLFNPITIASLLVSAIPSVRRAQGRFDPASLLTQAYLQRWQDYREQQRRMLEEAQREEAWRRRLQYQWEHEAQAQEEAAKSAEAQAEAASKFLTTGDPKYLSYLPPSAQASLWRVRRSAGESVETTKYIDPQGVLHIVTYDKKTGRKLQDIPIGPTKKTETRGGCTQRQWLDLVVSFLRNGQAQNIEEARQMANEVCRQQKQGEATTAQGAKPGVVLDTYRKYFGGE